MPVDVSVESSVEGIVNGEDRADMYGRDPGNRLMTNFLNLSLDFFDLRVEDNFIVRLSTPSSPRTSRSFSSILHVNPICFSYSPNPLPFTQATTSFLSIQQLFVPFSPPISDLSIIPLLRHFSPCPHDFESAISLHASRCQLFSGLAEPIPSQLNLPFLHYSFSNLQFRNNFIFKLSSPLLFPFISSTALQCVSFPQYNSTISHNKHQSQLGTRSCAIFRDGDRMNLLKHWYDQI
jgi:hypothetical protein